jgi:hypothetical protein
VFESYSDERDEGMTWEERREGEKREILGTLSISK